MEMIAIGKIRTSVGVRGYFKVLSFSGETAHFKKLKGHEIELQLKERRKTVKVEDVRMSGSNLTMKIEGIENPEDAKKLSGWELIVERSKAAGLGKDEYYLADLYGCKLVFEGEEVGVVTGLTGNGISDLLEIDVDGTVKLIPFMDRFVGEVNIETGTIELLEGWLLE